MNKRLKIINGRVITSHKIIDDASLLISDGIITEISKKKISSKADIAIWNYGACSNYSHGGERRPAAYIGYL